MRCLQKWRRDKNIGYTYFRMLPEAALEQPRLSSVSERVLAASGVITATAAAGAVWYFDPVSAGFFPACPLYTLTGFACPGCGLTRGFHALFHGDILTALDYNAMIPLILAFLGFLFLSMLLVAVRGRGFGIGKFSPMLLWVTFVLLLVFGIVRNLPFYPLSILFP